MVSRKILVNSGILLASIILSVGLLEIALAFYDPVVETIKGDRVTPPVNYDAIHPNLHNSGVAPEVHVHQNSLGFRGADPPADFADRLSIVTIGGSTTQSLPQADDRTWTARLGDAVAACFDRSWINNAGFDGHTSVAHIDLIRRYIIKLHPKVVVLLIGANEFYADMNGGDRERVAVAINFSNGFEGFWSSTRNLASLTFYALALRSHAVSLGLNLYRNFRAWQAGLTYGENDWVNLTEGDALPADGEAKLAAARSFQPAYAGRLELIIRLLRDAHIVPVLMTQPTLGGLATDPATGKDLSRVRYGLFWYRLFEIYNETMRQTARRENVDLIDLAQEVPKDTTYYIDNLHYSDAGAKKVSDLVSAELLPYLAKTFPDFVQKNCRNLSAEP